MRTQAYDYKNIKKFEPGMILGLTKKLSSFRFRYGFGGAENTNTEVHNFAETIGLNGLTMDLYEHNAQLFMFETARKITKTQTDFGKRWLKNHFFKKNGELRSGKNTEYVGNRVFKIAKNVSRFEFVGVLGLRNAYGEYVQFIPVYRTYNRKGEYFDYAPVHWGQPVIMEGN